MSFLCTGFPGALEPRRRFAPNGRQVFQHRLTGAHELRQRVRPIRAESFSLNLSGGIRRLRTAGTCGTRRGGKKGRHLRFLPSLNTRFPCWDSLGADGRLRKQEKDAAVGLPQRVFLRLFAVHRQITATHTGYFPQARHTRAAQLVSLEFADSTYGLGVRCNLSSQALSIITR